MTISSRLELARGGDRSLGHPTMTGAVDWSYVDQSLSAVERAAPSSVAPTGGREVATIVIASGSAAAINLASLDLRLEPGDVLAIALATATSSATCTVTMNWQEK